MNIIEALKRCNECYNSPTLMRSNKNKFFTIPVIDKAIYNAEFRFSIEDILSDDWEVVENRTDPENSLTSRYFYRKNNN